MFHEFKGAFCKIWKDILSAGGTEIQYIKKKCLHKQQQEKEAF